jgi:hypothetical protein
MELGIAASVNLVGSKIAKWFGNVQRLPHNKSLKTLKIQGRAQRLPDDSDANHNLATFKNYVATDGTNTASIPLQN